MRFCRNMMTAPMTVMVIPMTSRNLSIDIHCFLFAKKVSACLQ